MADDNAQCAWLHKVLVVPVIAPRAAGLRDVAARTLRLRMSCKARDGGSAVEDVPDDESRSLRAESWTVRAEGCGGGRPAAGRLEAERCAWWGG
jgi:hypothetical protein